MEQFLMYITRSVCTHNVNLESIVCGAKNVNSKSWVPKITSIAYGSLTMNSPAPHSWFAQLLSQHRKQKRASQLTKISYFQRRSVCLSLDLVEILLYGNLEKLLRTADNMYSYVVIISTTNLSKTYQREYKIRTTKNYIFSITDFFLQIECFFFLLCS